MSAEHTQEQWTYHKGDGTVRAAKGHVICDVDPLGYDDPKRIGPLIAAAPDVKALASRLAGLVDSMQYALGCEPDERWSDIVGPGGESEGAYQQAQFQGHIEEALSRAKSMGLVEHPPCTPMPGESVADLKARVEELEGLLQKTARHLDQMLYTAPELMMERMRTFAEGLGAPIEAALAKAKEPTS